MLPNGLQGFLRQMRKPSAIPRDIVCEARVSGLPGRVITEPVSDTVLPGFTHADIYQPRWTKWVRDSSIWQVNEIHPDLASHQADRNVV